MLKVIVELDKYGLGVQVEKLAEIHISNDGTSASHLRGNYDVVALQKRTGAVIRRGKVQDWPRTSKPVSALVKKSLEALGY